MSFTEESARTETVPSMSDVAAVPADNGFAAPDETAHPTDWAAYEPMPPVPAPELAAAMGEDSELGPIVGWITKAWKRARSEGPVHAVRNSVHEGLQTPMTRRQFLGRTAATGATLGLAGQAAALNHYTREFDNAMGEIWPDDQPSFHFIGEVPKDPKQLAIFFPGFGDTGEVGEAEDVKRTGHIDPEIPFGFLDYSNEGASIQQLVSAIRDKIPNIEHVESLTLVCRSLGGPFAIAVAAELGIPVSNIVFCSSPYLTTDGEYGGLGADASLLPDSMIGATSVKYFANYWTSATRNTQTSPLPEFNDAAMALLGHFDSLGNWRVVLRHVMAGLDKARFTNGVAWQQTISGASPIAEQNELKTWDSELLPTSLDQLDTPQGRRYLRQLRRVFIPGYTQVLYTATDDPSTDHVVKVLSSAHYYRQFFRDIVGLHANDVRIEGLPYDGHADIGATMRSVSPWLRTHTKEELDLAS